MLDIGYTFDAGEGVVSLCGLCFSLIRAHCFML